MNKFAALTAAALIGSATFAAAQEVVPTVNAFGIIPVQTENNLIEIPLVTARRDGVVEIRPIVDERSEDVLGSQVVTAGANENVKITLTQPPVADSLRAVLVIDGLDVAMEEIELSPPGG